MLGDMGAPSGPVAVLVSRFMFGEAALGKPGLCGTSQEDRPLAVWGFSSQHSSEGKVLCPRILHFLLVTLSMTRAGVI